MTRRTTPSNPSKRDPQARPKMRKKAMLIDRIVHSLFVFPPADPAVSPGMYAQGRQHQHALDDPA